MEKRGDFSFGFKLTDSATETFRIAPRNGNSNMFGGHTILAAIGTPTTSVSSVLLPVTDASPVSGVSGTATTSDGKMKRGRPRKYVRDGKLTMPLCPMPISSFVPLTGDFSDSKRGRGRPNNLTKKSHKLDIYKLEPGVSDDDVLLREEIRMNGSLTCYTPIFEVHEPFIGETIVCYAGDTFTPHIIRVADGEDVSMKIMLFSQQETQAICILWAQGTVSNVMLRQPTTSGGTLTYEGKFDILTLSGSFFPFAFGGLKRLCGGMSVSLLDLDGHVLGGGLAGVLVADGPVEVMLGTFVEGPQPEHKPKKRKTETVSTVIQNSNNPIGEKPILNGGNAGPPNATQEGLGSSPADDEDMSSSGEDSQDHSLSD